MAAIDARRGAGRVEQDRIDRRVGLPCAQIGLGDLRNQTRAREVFGQSLQPLGGLVERGDMPARCCQLHRLAARRGAQVERAAPCPLPQQPRRAGGSDVLHPPGPLGKAGQFGNRNAIRQADMAGGEASTAQFFGPARGFRRVAQADVHGRPDGIGARRCLDHRCAPLRVPAGGDLCRQSRWHGQRRRSAGHGAKNAMDQLARAAIDQRQRSGDGSMGRRVERQRLD